VQLQLLPTPEPHFARIHALHQQMLSRVSSSCRHTKHGEVLPCRPCLYISTIRSPDSMLNRQPEELLAFRCTLASPNGLCQRKVNAALLKHPICRFGRIHSGVGPGPNEPVCQARSDHAVGLVWLRGPKISGKHAPLGIFEERTGSALLPRRFSPFPIAISLDGKGGLLLSVGKRAVHYALDFFFFSFSVLCLMSIFCLFS
jgi:hypothetical protein